VLGSFDSVHRARINTGSAIGTKIGIDYTLVPFFADSVHRARIITGTTVGAVVSNGVSHEVTPFVKWVQSLYVENATLFVPLVQ
jgi:hypothetical protein